MSNKTLQVRLIVLTLFVVGLGAVLYKIFVLGFPLLPEKRQTVWAVEGHVSLQAQGGPLSVSLNMPDDSEYLQVMEISSTGDRGLRFAVDKEGPGRRATWQGEVEKGPVDIFLQGRVVRRDKGGGPGRQQRQEEPQLALEEAQQAAATALAKQVADRAGSWAKTQEMLRLFNSPNQPEAQLLLRQAGKLGGKMRLISAVLTQAGVKVARVKGLRLEKNSRNKKLQSFLEIEDDGRWLLVNPRTGKIEPGQDLLLWQEGSESVLEVVGGKESRLRLATLASQMMAGKSALAAARKAHHPLVDFSIYSLPLADQNTFKLLLLIPLGALVVVILRNLVGISTSGTFMPILIALVFLQTKIVTGMALFLVVVSVGLVLRSYLSHLNLLLVPRISAVLVFVIIIYVAISVVSNKLGFAAGLQVTFFPMIIISWTIERMCVLWEEEGGRDVLIQGSGSLLAASLIYLVMSNHYVSQLVYVFPELLLVVLAIIIMIGSYTGYRLSELRRFEPLVRP